MLDGKGYCNVGMVSLVIYDRIDHVAGGTKYRKRARMHAIFSLLMSTVMSGG